MKVATRPFTRTRHGFTLSAEQLMEEAARKEMGARIRDLRERSPYKQAHMAEKLHIGLRMYQRLEERGTTDWERAQEIAAIHGVDPHWIWDGEERPATPDLIGQINGPSQLDRIESILIRLDERQARLEQRQQLFYAELQAAKAEEAVDDETPGRVPSETQSERASASTGKAPTASR